MHLLNTARTPRSKATLVVSYTGITDLTGTIVHPGLHETQEKVIDRCLFRQISLSRVTNVTHPRSKVELHTGKNWLEGLLVAQCSLSPGAKLRNRRLHALTKLASSNPHLGLLKFVEEV